MRYVELVELRRQIYRHYAQTGGPPALAAEDLQALEAVHAVVLDAQGAIAFANPFATAPTAFEVSTRRRVYHAICAWDALGVLAALHCDGSIQTSCPDCAERIAVGVHGGEADPADAVVHFLVSAARWYENLGFT